MEIEIKTTKTKLTKQKILQMLSLPVSKLHEAESLGFLNLNGKVGKVALVKHLKDYYLLNMKWELRGVNYSNPYWGYKSNKGECVKNFKDDLDSVKLFPFYEKLVKEAESKGQIYY